MKVVVSIERVMKVVDEVLIVVLICLLVIIGYSRMSKGNFFWISALSIHTIYILYSFVRMVLEIYEKLRIPRCLTDVFSIRIASMLSQTIIMILLSADTTSVFSKSRPVMERMMNPLDLVLKISVLYLAQLSRKITSREASPSILYRVIFPFVSITAIWIAVLYDYLNEDGGSFGNISKFAFIFSTLLMSTGSFIGRDVPGETRGSKGISKAFAVMFIFLSIFLAYSLEMHKKFIGALLNQEL